MELLAAEVHRKTSSKKGLGHKQLQVNICYRTQSVVFLPILRLNLIIQKKSVGRNGFGKDF